MVEYKKQGIDLYVADTAIIKHPNEILLGNHVAIDHFVYISTRANIGDYVHTCLLYTSPSPRDRQKSRMPSSA